MKALTFASRSPDQHETLGTTFDEDSTVFFMEQLVTVAMENKLVDVARLIYVHTRVYCDFLLDIYVYENYTN